MDPSVQSTSYPRVNQTVEVAPRNRTARLYKDAVTGRMDFLQSQDFKGFDHENRERMLEVTAGRNTVLHVAATSSGNASERTCNYIKFATEVCKHKPSLLWARNKLNETPLHCATKAGNIEMVLHFISLVEKHIKDLHKALQANRSPERVDELIREFLTPTNMHSELADKILDVLIREVLTTTNTHGETTLQEAERADHLNKSVDKLFREFLTPTNDGTGLHEVVRPDSLERVDEAGRANSPDAMRADSPETVPEAVRADTPEIVEEATRADTPEIVEEATRADNPEIVEEATRADNPEIVDQFIREFITATNKHGETALHEAVRAGSLEMVRNLISTYERQPLQADSQTESTNFEHKIMKIVETTNVSPLYLACMINKLDIAREFISYQRHMVSCEGPNKQNALHVAVLERKDVSNANTTSLGRIRFPPFFTRPTSSEPIDQATRVSGLTSTAPSAEGITDELLYWDNSLAIRKDVHGSTPLHYAVSVGNKKAVNCILQHNQDAVYEYDNDGLCPIHIAAKCGRKSMITRLIDQFPDSDGLLDNDGRNFLHIAIISGKGHMIYDIIDQNWAFSYFKRNEDNITPEKREQRRGMFLRMINSRDIDGNTPLHLASENGYLDVVKFLITFEEVYSSTMNNKGHTPIDLAIKKAEHGFMHRLNTQYNLLRLLMWAGAHPSPLRLDRVQDDLELPKYNPKTEIEKAETVTRSLGIISVLTATVTFAASFALPGGYIADGDQHKGAPVLYRQFLFKAFIVANTLAFMLSILATSWLIYAGSANVDFNLRMTCLVFSVQMVKIATKATAVTFSLAISAVLHQVNLAISILILVVTLVVFLFGDPSIGAFMLWVPIFKRLGFKGLFKSVNPTIRKRVDMGIGQRFSCMFFHVNVGVGQKFSVMIFHRLLMDVVLLAIIFLLALI